MGLVKIEKKIELKNGLIGTGTIIKKGNIALLTYNISNNGNENILPSAFAAKKIMLGLMELVKVYFPECDVYETYLDLNSKDREITKEVLGKFNLGFISEDEVLEEGMRRYTKKIEDKKFHYSIDASSIKIAGLVVGKYNIIDTVDGVGVSLALDDNLLNTNFITHLYKTMYNIALARKNNVEKVCVYVNPFNKTEIDALIKAGYTQDISRLDDTLKDGNVLFTKENLNRDNNLKLTKEEQ